MHICMVTSEFPPKIGGVSYYVYSLSTELIKKGHRVTVITRGFWKGLRRNYVEGVTVYRLPYLPLYPFHVKLHEIFLNKVFRALEPNFDIVHVHHPLSPPIHTSLPVVVTAHTTGSFQARSIELLDLRSLVYKLFYRCTYGLELRTLRNADVITSVSKKVSEELHEYYGVRRNSVITVGNGVDTSFFKPGNTKKTGYILYTGRLFFRKGLIDLVKSAKYICLEYPKVSFVLTGRGPLESKLKGLVKMMQLSSNFSFTGYVSRKNLLNYYQNATIYVLPSYYEGFPTALLEAMACGIPVVATAVGGVPDIVVNGKNGFIIPVKDPKAIASAVSELLKNEDQRIQMGKLAREMVERNYSWDKIACKILNCYESVAA